MVRPPAEFGISLDRHGGEFRRGELDEHIGARGFQLGQLGLDVGIGHLVGGFSDDRQFAAEAVLQALQIFLAHAVVLVEDGDAAAWMVFENVLRIDLGFGRVGRQETHGPGKLLRLVPGRRARQREQLGHLLRVQIRLDRRVGVGADGAQGEENLIVLNELAGRLHDLDRVIRVVIGDDVDLAAVDAAFGVDLVHIGRDDLADDAVGRRRPGDGRRDADADFVGGRWSCVRAVTHCKTGHRGQRQRCAAPRRSQ
jgi:hypothetical protein